MSSMAASYLQVPARSKYLVARASTFLYTPSSTNAPTAVSLTVAANASTYTGTTPNTNLVSATDVFTAAGRVLTLTGSSVTGTTLTLVAAVSGLQLGMILSGGAGGTLGANTSIVSLLTGTLGGAASTYQVSTAATGTVTAPTATGGAVGTIYRDKGKRVKLVSATTGRDLAIFAQVQRYIPELAYAGTGYGVAEDPNSGSGYVQVWDAFDPTNVTVVDSCA